MNQLKYNLSLPNFLTQKYLLFLEWKKKGESNKKGLPGLSEK